VAKPKPAAAKPKPVFAPGSNDSIATVLVHKIDAKPDVPLINGAEDEDIWEAAAEEFVKLAREDGRKLRVCIKAAYFSDTIFFLVRWYDKSEDKTHETLIWNEKDQKYFTGEDKEDSIVLLFYLNDVDDTCMKSGEEASGDYWHWQAARSKGSGHAYDGRITLSSLKLADANSYTAKDGRQIWIQKVKDSGNAPWKKQLPNKFIGNNTPSYLSEKPTKSSADVKAKGDFDKNRWTVEFSRKLNTDNADDIVFGIKNEYKFAIAVYDGSVDQSHYTSQVIRLVFQNN
jgi:hypothetical protein